MAAASSSFVPTSQNIRSPLEEIWSGVTPLLKLLFLSLIGLIVAHPKFHYVPKESLKLLSKLVFALFLPCLIFTHLGSSITLSNLALWWFVPLNVVLSTFLGCALGVIVVLICRPPPEFVRFVIVATGFGNTGNLPLAIVSSVCHSSDHPFGPYCHRQGVAYVSLAQWVSVILVYTLVYHMMEPPMAYYEVVEGGESEEEAAAAVDIVGEGVSSPLLVEAEWPGMEDKETQHSKTPFIARVFAGLHSTFSQIMLPDVENLRLDDADENQNSISRSSDYSPKSLHCLAEPRVIRRIRIVAEQTPIQHILQPPTIASMLAILIGMVPQLKAFVFGQDAPLSFFTDSLEILAGAMVPSVMLILGGMLAEGPLDSRLGLKTMIGVVIARLLVLPLIGIGVVGLADRLGVLVVGDLMYRFVLLLQYSTPSAILLGAIASLRGYAVREASALLFWQHILAVVSLSVYIVVYFKLLSFV